MAKLYPPQIESSLPAFVGSIILVPFELNRAVGRSEFDEISLIVKAVSTGVQKIITKTDKILYRNDEQRYYAEFKLDENIFKPQVGQYYKVQIAFINKSGEIGYYSSVSVIKCTAKPNVYIENLNMSLNINTYEYIGHYEQYEDIAEKVYTYRFDLKDRNQNIVATSGDQVHNSSNDIDSYSSFDKWNLTKTLEYGQSYYLTYSIKTTNNLNVVSASYLVRDIDTVDIGIDMVLYTENNFEEGNISLILDSKNNKPVTGNFIIVRRNINEDKWHQVYKFNLLNSYVNNYLVWEDYTIQQGISYEYAIQAYNSRGLYSNKFYAVDIITKKPGAIMADFEHAFLFDGERQLKIKYNPKVTSFKSTILESKVDTLGGPYPFFFRNGDVEYKEFPISGLISILSDPEEKFVQGVRPQDPSRRRTPANQEEVEDLGTWLTSENFYRERQFKMQVLEWLSNGQPKVFRSPEEGNYIVRLMNSSLTPNDTLGRMLHTFNSTAYEIAEYNFDNLIKYGFIKVDEPSNQILRYSQISLQGYNPDDLFVFPYSPEQLKIINAKPGTIIGLHFMNGEEILPIAIGTTGTYEIQANEKPIYAISLISGSSDGWGNLTVEYSYSDTKVAEYFNYIANVQMYDKITQFVGEGEKTNLINKIEDVRKEIEEIYYLKITPRKIVKLYKSGNKYYRDSGYTIEMRDKDWSQLSLYELNGKYYNYPNFNSPIKLNYMVKIGNNPAIDFGGNAWNHDENGKIILPRSYGRYDALTKLQDIKYISAGAGVIVDIAYSLKEYEYVVESYNSQIAQAKEAWRQAEEKFNNPNIGDNINVLYNTMIQKYNIYLNILNKEVERIKEEGGIV